MPYTKICVAAALQRYLDITPIAARIRDLAGVLAAAYSVPVSVLTVEAPVELLPDVDTMEEKIERYSPTANGTFSYDKPGRYKVVLEVRDARWRTKASETATVEVKAAVGSVTPAKKSEGVRK